MTDRSDRPRSAGKRAERSEDLRATSDAIREGARRLDAIETDKARLPADDPRVDALSEAAVETADALARQARLERQLSADLD